MEDKKDDPGRLEILASIHFLKKVYKGMTKTEILKRVKEKQSYFTAKQCRDGWDELKQAGMI